MPFNKSEYIWFNGEFVAWDDAKVHVLSHALHYGSSIFEGIRAYDTPKGPAVFRLKEHVRRLFESCKVYRMEIPFTPEEIEKAIVDTVAKNGLKGCYIRPLVFRGYEQLGVSPFGCPVEVIVAAWDWGKYLVGEADEAKGVRAGVSSWRRMAPDTFPAAVKAGGHYTNSQLLNMEAHEHGYDEAIALDVYGYVAEGSGENIFMVRDGELLTPQAGSILGGITRNAVLKIASELGYTTHEVQIAREHLYIADELFFCGTAAEITPIGSVDGLPVGNGLVGPITEAIRERFFDIATGKAPDVYGWLTHAS